MTLSERLATWASQASYESLPVPVKETVNDHVKDTLGVCVAGRDSDAGTTVRAVAVQCGGVGEALLVGEDARLPACWAAFVNGTYAHSLDFDDTHLPSIIHPSAPLVPAVLAQAEAVHADGRAIVTALAIGYEVMCRLAMAQYDPEARNSVFFDRGLHATSYFGAIGAAAACGRLLRLPPDKLANAMAIACSMGSGIIEANRTGGSVKKAHTGWAAHSGVLAAALAQHGLTGPPTVFEGRFGFYPAFCGERWRPEVVTASLGDVWEAPLISVKPYPCNHYTHTLVDAALRLKERGVKPADVVSVQIRTASAALLTIGDPIEEKRRPQTPYHAKFSGPFVFATSLVGGSGLGVSLVDFSYAALADPERLRISNSCTVVEDTECDGIFPTEFPSVVKVTLASGVVLEERVMANRGGPARPLTPAELREKLKITAGACAERIDLCTTDLSQIPSASELVAATR